MRKNNFRISDVYWIYEDMELRSSAWYDRLISHDQSLKFSTEREKLRRGVSQRRYRDIQNKETDAKQSDTDRSREENMD